MRKSVVIIFALSFLLSNCALPAFVAVAPMMTYAEREIQARRSNSERYYVQLDEEQTTQEEGVVSDEPAEDTSEEK